MRLEHAAVTVIGLLFMVYGATAVVGGPEPGEDEMTIMGQGSGSSASASKGVSENGTQWTAEVSMVNRSGNVTENRLEGISYSGDEYKVEFTGHIQAPTPCHVIDHEIQEDGDDYILNVKTVNDELDNDSNESEGVCVQQVTMIEYDGSFSSPDRFTVEVRHNNETVNTLEHPGIDVEPEPKKGFMRSLKKFFSGLF